MKIAAPGEVPTGDAGRQFHLVTGFAPDISLQQQEDDGIFHPLVGGLSEAHV